MPSLVLRGARREGSADSLTAMATPPAYLNEQPVGTLTEAPATSRRLTFRQAFVERGPSTMSWGARRATAVRFVRFAVVGGLASAVLLTLFAALTLSGVHYLMAGVVSYLAAIATNFAVNRQWTFGRGVRRFHAQALSFLIVQLCVGSLNLSLLHLFVSNGMEPAILGQILAAAVLVPVNFLASQRWGFR